MIYDGFPEYIEEPRWHVWNIPLAEFNDVNLANVTKIAIGFGDGNSPGAEPNGYGTVYFEDIILRNGPAEDIYYDGSVYLDEDPFKNGYHNWPLLLKQDCRLIDAGGDYIDEQQYLIGKTTAYEGIPDSNVVDIGFHYFNWYYVNAGDSNVLDADLNQDDTVNFKDFAILANGWLTAYDMNDLKIMANEWLRVAEPNIQLTFVWDANIGLAEFSAGGTLLDTQRIFLLIDGKYVGEISGFRNGYPLGVDISEYGGGEKQLKAVSINSAGQVTCSNIVNFEFSCPLNYCLMPSTYEPNKPLYFSAFNPSAGDVTVKVYADCGNLVWSQDYNGVSFFDSIPEEITRQYEFDYISFDTSSGGYVRKISDPVEPGIPHNVKALIILPNLHIRLFDHRTIEAVRTAFKNRGIKYETLGGGSASYDLIALYAATNPVKYIYIGTHGGEDLDGVLRTWVELSDGRCVSMKLSDPGAPSWCEDLGSYWEGRAKSFASMGFTTLEFAYFDSCSSASLKINAQNQLVRSQPGQQGLLDVPYSDMSLALGMHEPSTSRFYQGWWWDPNVGMPWPFKEDEYRKWTRLEWEKLGDEESLYNALTYLINEETKIGKIGKFDPINNYRLRGQGIPQTIFLRD